MKRSETCQEGCEGKAGPQEHPDKGVYVKGWCKLGVNDTGMVSSVVLLLFWMQCQWLAHPDKVGVNLVSKIVSYGWTSKNTQTNGVYVKGWCKLGVKQDYFQ